MHCWCNTEKFASASEDQLSGGVLCIYTSKHPTKQRDHEKEGPVHRGEVTEIRILANDGKWLII